MDFNVEPYYDDFEGDSGAKEQNYMKIMFRPGYAVQARELTQLQSILQNQIKSFGNHIFKDGSPVQGGHLTVNKSMTCLFLQQGDYLLDDFKNQLVISSSGSDDKKAKVLAVDDSVETSTIGGALLVKQMTSERFVDSEQIEVSGDPTITASLLSANGTSTGSVVSMNQGIFYVGGYFVFVPEQTLVLESNSTPPTYRIGLEVDDNIIDEAQDSNLLDPAQSSFNYQAPGATRYQFALNLTKRTLDSTDTSNFYELLRIENGQITKQVVYPLYSEINKTLARRTDDQSGSFTVKPFRITTAEDTSNSSNYLINIEPGKAYVKGYEYETLGTTKLSIPKARTSSSSKDYDLSLDYGNYISCYNLKGGSNGLFNITTYQDVDLHCVPSANINTSAAGVTGSYARTLVATARIRNIEYSGVGLTGPEYYFYLLNANNYSSNSTNHFGTSADLNSINFSTQWSNYSNAYVGMSVTITSGNNGPSGIVPGWTGTIVSYNGASKVATVTPPLYVTCNASTRLTVGFALKHAVSLVVRPVGGFGVGSVYASQNSQTAYYSCAEINGRTAALGTSLFAAQYNKLIYKLPETYIARDSRMYGMTFQAKKMYTNKSVTSGTLTLQQPGDLQTYEDFIFGLSGGARVSALTANKNLLLVVRDSQSSGLSNGQVITFTDTGPYYITQTSSQSITINTGTPGTFLADIITTVEVNNANTNARRTKTLRGNTAAVSSIRATDSPLNATDVTGATTVKLDSSNAIVWFTSGTPLTNLKTPGVKQSLYVPDVIKIIKVYDSSNTAEFVSSTNATDVTSRYTFDSGQTDNYYDHASLTLKYGSQPPSGQVAVMMENYQHSGTGFFNVDSYSQYAYENNKIPYYSSAKIGAYALRDSIDFRPTRGSGTTSNAISGASIAYPYFNMEIANYEFYLPRMDKLSLIADGTFKLTQGAPSSYPRVPADPSDSMTLYNLTIPAYTTSAKAIPIQYIDNRRYTMKDIGILEKRIESLEYYTSLNLLETTAARQKIFSVGGVEKAIYGFIADQFEGFNIADNKSEDLICKISKYALTPYKITDSLGFKFSSGVGSYKINDKTLSLSFTEEACISQYAASNTASVQPYQFAEYNGSVFLNPESDYYYSTGLVPEIIGPPQNTIKRQFPVVDANDPNPDPPVVGGGDDSPIDNIKTVTVPLSSVSGGQWGDITWELITNLTGFGNVDLDVWIPKETNTSGIEDASSQTATVNNPTNSTGAITLRGGGTNRGGDEVDMAEFRDQERGRRGDP